MQARFCLLVLAGIALFVPNIGGAQNRAHPSAVHSASGAPLLETSATAFRMADQRLDSANVAMQRRQAAGRPVALMIVGGAAILIGAVIGDAPGALFMIGGAVAFLYGLYHYLQ